MMAKRCIKELSRQLKSNCFLIKGGKGNESKS